MHFRDEASVRDLCAYIIERLPELCEIPARVFEYLAVDFDVVRVCNDDACRLEAKEVVNEPCNDVFVPNRAKDLLENIMKSFS